MKITADTNILLSATFWSGDSDRIFLKIEAKEIELVLSEEILEEFLRVLNYKEIQDKIRNKNLEMKRTVEKIISISTLTYPHEKLNIVKDDPSDNIILECAKAEKVDYIITNDNHLLKIKEFEGIRIVKPDEFLKELNR